MARELEDAKDAKHSQRDEGAAHVFVVTDTQSQSIAMDADRPVLRPSGDLRKISITTDHHLQCWQATDHHLLVGTCLNGEAR